MAKSRVDAPASPVEPTTGARDWTFDRQFEQAVVAGELAGSVVVLAAAIDAIPTDEHDAVVIGRCTTSRTLVGLVAGPNAQRRHVNQS
jgi:hypothetical protein